MPVRKPLQMYIQGSGLFAVAMLCVVQSESIQLQSLTPAPSPSDMLHREPVLLIPDVADMTTQFYNFILPLFSAKITDTFPTAPLQAQQGLEAGVNKNFFRLKICEKTAISECMPSSAALHCRWIFITK
jgi:hypothetical protein